MIVWLVKAGEPTPLDPGVPRLMRTGNLSKVLAERDHSVVWWTAAFDHQRKVVRDTAGADRLPPNLEIRLVKSPGYANNVSLRRWFDDVMLARALYRDMVRADQRPAIIVCSYPLIFTSLAAILFGKRHGIPVLLDVRDMWPDIFSHSTKGFRASAYELFGAVHKPISRFVLSAADGLVAITDPFLEWALHLAGRSRVRLDAVFPLTSAPASLSAAERAAATEWWRQRGVTPETRNICYFGTFGSTVDLETVVEAGRRLRDRRKLRIVLCGSGASLEALRDQAADAETIVLPGWVDGAQIRTLMAMSVAGLAPYRHRHDFLCSVPNKVIEYLSAELPVISGVEGLIGQLIDQYSCGLKYAEGDPEGLAEAVTQLLDDEGVQQRLSWAAGDLYDRCYRADIVYKDFARHVEHAADAALRGRHGMTPAALAH